MADSTLTTERVSVPRSAPAKFPLTSVCMVLIAVSVLIKAWAAFGSWFYEDDFHFLSVVASGGNDLDWYLTRHNVHFMPLSLLLATPVGLMGGFAWWAAALEITVMYALGAVACWWMLNRVFGSNPRILAPLTFYLFSPMIIPAITWWAAAINLVAVQAPLFVLIGSHVEFLRTRRRRWLVLGGAMLVLMSGFYVKALVVTAVLGLFTLCYASQEPNLVRRFLTTVRRWWQAWVVYAVITLGVMAVYIRQGESSSGGGGDTTGVSQTFENLVLRNLVPGLVGGPWNWADMGGFPRTLSNPNDFSVAVALGVVIAVFAYAVHRWYNAWLPLVFLAPPVLATFVAMSAFRTGSFPFLSLETRYWADLLPYLVLAIGVTVMDIPGLPSVRGRRVPDSPTPPTGALLGVGIAFVVSSLLSTVSYVEPWHTQFPARQFVEGAITHAEKAGSEVTVADVGAPGSVMSPSFYPRNTPDLLFAPQPGLIRGTDAGTDLKLLDAWGEPSLGLAEPNMDLDLSDADCITRAGEIDLPSKTFDFPFWVTLTATFDKSTTVFVSAGQAGHTLRVPSGRHQLTFRTDGSYDRITASVAREATMCPESIRIGTNLEVAK